MPNPNQGPPQGEYTRATERFKAAGVDLNSPVDAVRPGYYPVLENVRSYTDGIIQPRQGFSQITTSSTAAQIAGSPIWQVRRVNDPITSKAVRVLKRGGTLTWMSATSSLENQATYDYGSGSTSVALRNTQPSVFVPYRPDQSPASWMYIADAQNQHKIMGSTGSSPTQGTVHKIGVAPPVNAPIVELAAQNWDYQAAAAPTTTSTSWMTDTTVLSSTWQTINRLSTGTTITKALNDLDGSGGWASYIVPAAVVSVMGEGEYIEQTVAGIYATGVVHKIYPASGSGTISSMLYDTGYPNSTGSRLTIVPTKSLKSIVRNCVIQVNSSQYFRVTDVITGQDNNVAYRLESTSTSATAGSTFTAVSSFRASGMALNSGAGIADIHAGTAAGTVMIISTATGGGTGWIQTPVSWDLTQFGAFGAGISDQDYIHLSFFIDDSTKLTQGRLLLDCDGNPFTISSASTTGTGGTTLVQIAGSMDHQLQNGDTVYITGATSTNINGQWIVTRNTNTTFSLNGSVGTAGGAFGSVQPIFKRNYYWRAFTPDDLAAAAKAKQTALAAVTGQIQNSNTTPVTKTPLTQDQIDARNAAREARREARGGTRGSLREIDPTLPTDLPLTPVDNTPNPKTIRDQIGTGDAQWTELIFRRGEFERTGEDKTRGFANIGAVRLELTLNSGLSSTTTVIFNSLTVYGGAAPDITDLGVPYQYRYRYRVSATGARSNWSPANISGIEAHQDAIIVSCSSSAAPEVDKIDIQRIGGALTTWNDVGTVANGSSYTDTISDLAASAAAPYSEDNVNFQPWPIVTVPASGTLSSGCGPYLSSAAGFSTSWAPGTAIKVNGINTAIRRVLSSSLLEVIDNLGTLGAVGWEIPEPLLLGQPLPIMWGPYNGVFFACGSSVNPGTLYWSNGNDPDTTVETNKLEITSPSEPLMNGIVFNGRCYVWSSDRMFEVDQLGPNQFIAVEVPGGKGLISQWALCAGEKIWYMSRDGIYQTGGGDSISITDETLKPLFVKEGNHGVAVNGFNYVDLTQTAYLRLSYYDGYLYFNYKDSAGAFRAMAYCPRADKPGWWPDSYPVDLIGMTSYYGEEGQGVHSLLACGADAITAKLYQVSGTADGINSIAIPCHVRTQYFDAQDRRAQKRWGDFVLDADPNNATLNMVAYEDNATTSSLTLTPATMTGTGRTQQIVDISSGSDPAGAYSRNLALDVQWSSATATPQLFLWEPSYSIQPEVTDLRATLWDDCGFEGDKFFQGIEIQANTLNVARTVQVEYDGIATNVADTLTVQHNGNQQKAYPFHPAFTAHTVRLRPTDAADTWKDYKYRWIWQPEPPLADRWETQQTSHGMDGFLHLKAMYVTLKSTAAVTMTITRTDDGTVFTYTIPSTAGVKEKVYVPLAVIKGKAFIYVFTSSVAFRLYKDDTNILLKPWASEDSFRGVSVFGAVHGDGAAPI